MVPATRVVHRFPVYAFYRRAQRRTGRILRDTAHLSTSSSAYLCLLCKLMRERVDSVRHREADLVYCSLDLPAAVKAIWRVLWHGIAPCYT